MDAPFDESAGDCRMGRCVRLVGFGQDLEFGLVDQPAWLFRTCDRVGEYIFTRTNEY